jgi:serine/threonine protein kinase
MRIEKVVGKGTFGEVYKALDKRCNEEVALKKIITTREKEGFPVTAIREIKILNMMNHPNIVNLREIVIYDDGEADNSEPTVRDKDFNLGDVFMVFDFADYDLCGLLKASGLQWTDQHKKCYLYQLLSGVHYLHQHKILHRDIKSANILVTKNNVLKIADWGLAKMLPSNKEQLLSSPVVTLWYRSPELILGSRKYGCEIDMWSVG